MKSCETVSIYYIFSSTQKTKLNEIGGPKKSSRQTPIRVSHVGIVQIRGQHNLDYAMACDNKIGKIDFPKQLLFFKNDYIFIFIFEITINLLFIIYK